MLGYSVERLNSCSRELQILKYQILVSVESFCKNYNLLFSLLYLTWPTNVTDLLVRFCMSQERCDAFFFPKAPYPPYREQIKCSKFFCSHFLHSLTNFLYMSFKYCALFYFAFNKDIRTVLSKYCGSI